MVVIGILLSFLRLLLTENYCGDTRPALQSDITSENAVIHLIDNVSGHGNAAMAISYSGKYTGTVDTSRYAAHY
jgi:hypothetical protein